MIKNAFASYFPLLLLSMIRKTNDYEPGHMKNMSIHQINAKPGHMSLVPGG
jgi:hypothetical protein